MKVIVAVYKDNDPTIYKKLALRVSDEVDLNQVNEDVECFLEEQFYALKDEDDE